MTTLPQTRSSLSLQELLRWLCCPLCKGDLELGQELLFCAHCQRGYPIVLGIPDLRVYPDPYVTFEEDHFKGRQVQEQEAKLSFPELLQFYWENVSKPPTPVELRNRFIRHLTPIVHVFSRKSFHLKRRIHAYFKPVMRSTPNSTPRKDALQG